MLDRALRDATRVYQVRYLADKYGLSFDDWVEQAMAHDAAESSHDDATDEQPIDVEAIMQATIHEHEHTGPDESAGAENALSDGNSR